MLVEDAIEENSFDLFFNKTNSGNNEICDDIFMSLDADVPMLDDSIDFNILETEVNLPVSSPSVFSCNSSPPSSIKSEHGSTSPSSGGHSPESGHDFDKFDFFNVVSVNPDDFLNDIKSESNSSSRDTPSPTGSSEYSGCSSTKSENGTAGNFYSIPVMNQQDNVVTQQNYINYMTINTPPVSPPLAIQQQPIILNPTQGNNFKIVQGTLIPITTIPVIKNGAASNVMTPSKKIKIQPKPIAGQISNPGTKKSIILSAQDFSAFMKNVNENGSEKPASIILKTNQVVKKESIVLPKQPPAQLISTIKNSQSIAPPQNQSRMDKYNNIDDKTLKKQQRMIKNRESACLSRKKKKEYVTTLEGQIKDLENEISNLKQQNSILRDQLKLCGCRKIRSPATIMTPTAKKSTAFLLAMVFMVSVNLGPLSGIFANEPSDPILNPPSPIVHHSRGLLWVDEPTVYPNESITFYENSTSADNVTTKYPICPMFINQTESIRIASDLRRWIGEPDYFNLSSKQYFELKGKLDKFAELFVPEKIHLTQSHPRSRRKLRSTKRSVKNTSTVKKINDLQPYQRAVNDMQVFDSSDSAIKFAEFFEEIRRRDDTFYVVSFSGDHLLLPALAHNKTLRPKMSLMLPTLGVNDSFSTEFVTLMQIDCEVINTSMIRVREKIIPDNLRQTAEKSNTRSKTSEQTTEKFQNATTSHSGQRSQTDDEEVLDKKFVDRNYKPYLLEKRLVKNLYPASSSNKNSFKLKP